MIKQLTFRSSKIVSSNNMTKSGWQHEGAGRIKHNSGIWAGGKQTDIHLQITRKRKNMGGKTHDCGEELRLF